jgi:5-methylcytosine-specific restriction endonuclease McrA
LFCEKYNLQVLCKSCHSKKSKIEKEQLLENRRTSIK